STSWSRRNSLTVSFMPIAFLPPAASRRRPAAPSTKKGPSAVRPGLRGTRRVLAGPSPLRRPASNSGSLDEALELPRADGVLELEHGLRLDLPDALARHLEDAADLLERVGVAVADAVPELDDLPLPVVQGLEDLLDLVLQHAVRRR